MNTRKYFRYAMLLLILLLPSVVLPVCAQRPEYFFTIHQSLRPPYTPEYGELLADELAKIGIKLEVETMDSPTWIDRLHKMAYEGATYDEGGMDIFVPRWGWGRYDPVLTEMYVHSYFKCELSTTEQFPDWHGSFTRWFNPRVDYLYDTSFGEPDINKRQEYMQEIADIVADEVPCIPVLWPEKFMGMRKDITNFEPRYGGGEIRGLKDIEITGKTLGDYVEFTFASPTPWRTVNFAGDTMYDWIVVNQLFDRLVDFDNDYNIIACLAESWELSEDQTTYTFHLRDDVYWHDGVKFTSADVKFSFERAMEPETGAKWKIVNPDSILAVEAPDDNTFVLKLDQFYAGILIAISSPDIIPILPKHVWEDVEPADMRGHEWNVYGPTVGTGPFKLLDVVPGEYVEFEANKEYWGGEPIVDHLFIRIIPETGTAVAALETGEVDMLMDAYNYEPHLEIIEGNADLKLIHWESGYIESIGINCQAPPLNNKWVRKAMASMVPKEHIVNDIRKGMGDVANQIAPPYSYGHNPDVQEYEYNLENAKEYMKKAGYDMQFLMPLEIPITVHLQALVIGLVAGGVIGGGIVLWRKKAT